MGRLRAHHLVAIFLPGSVLRLFMSLVLDNWGQKLLDR